MPETDAVVAPEAEAESLAAEKPAPRNNYAELQRIKDREVAEVRREAKDLASRASKAEAELARTSRELEALREHADFSGDDADRIKRLVDKEAALEARASTTANHERSITMKLLSAEHGIPAEDLESYDTLADMQIAALKWQLASANGQSPADTAVVEPVAESPVRSTFDVGVGTGAGKAISDYSDKEFAVHVARLQSESRKRQTQGPR